MEIGHSYLRELIYLRFCTQNYELTCRQLPVLTNGHYEEKWQRLHTMLEKMRDSDPLPTQEMELPDQEQYLKQTHILQVCLSLQ